MHVNTYKKKNNNFCLYINQKIYDHHSSARARLHSMPQMISCACVYVCVCVCLLFCRSPAIHRSMPSCIAFIFRILHCIHVHTILAYVCVCNCAWYRTVLHKHTCLSMENHLQSTCSAFLFIYIHIIFYLHSVRIANIFAIYAKLAESFLYFYYYYYHIALIM